VKLALVPTQSAYSAQFSGARSVILSGPASLYAKDYERNAIKTNCQFEVSDYGYQYIRSFYKLNRHISFTLDMILDDGALATYTAKFQSFKLASIVGTKHVVTCELEVKSLSIDDALDAAEFVVYQAFGGGSVEALNLFAQIIANWSSA
jgi:hypothetical protein